MALKYTTEIGFNKYLGATITIPDRTNTSKENVGTGNSSTTEFWLDQGNVIQNSETLYTGSTVEASAATTLVRTTQYTLDNDSGKITLTASGVASVASTSIFATYSYNQFGISNTAIQEALLAAEDEIELKTNTNFFDGTAASPDTIAVTNELHIGQGKFNRVYQTETYPIFNKTTSLSVNHSASAATVSVASTNGFPTSGWFGIGNNKVTYTGKTTNTFTGCTGMTDAQTTGTTVTSFVIEVSYDMDGVEPTWNVLNYGVDYTIDTQSGEIKISNNTYNGTILLDNWTPGIGIWDRFRISYLAGWDSIPSDITRLTHMIAAKELYYSKVANALSRGKDGFSSEGINGMDEWIKRTIDSYKCWNFKDVKPGELNSRYI